MDNLGQIREEAALGLKGTKRRKNFGQKNGPGAASFAPICAIRGFAGSHF
jgi:hypothetical protein